MTTSRSCGSMHCSYQHYQPGKITIQVSVLMTEYLVAISYELCMMYYVLYFMALMDVPVGINIEKSGMCVW